MHTKQEHIYYYCKGSLDNPEGVIKALEEKGVANPVKFSGNEDTHIYYADIDNEVERAIIGTEYADLIMRCGIELQPVEKAKRWREEGNAMFKGYYITNDSNLEFSDNCTNAPYNYNLFETKKMAKAALAMARISQIMANDKRFGGRVTDEEWRHGKAKYIIVRSNDEISKDWSYDQYYFLAFHTPEQRDLFMQENPDLVKAFLMIENNSPVL